MAEELKVRLVRCPKCENLLPEIPDYSIYRCGACGALLRAKKKQAVNGGALEKLEKERDGESIEKLEYLAEKEHESEKESNGFSLDRRKDRNFKERNVNLVSDSLLRLQNKETSIDSSKRDVKEETVGYDDKYRLPLKHPVGNRRSESVNSNRGKGFGKISGQFERPAASLRSEAVVSNLGFDGRRRFSNFAYAGEGPSSSSAYLSSSSYGHGKQAKSFDDADGPNRFAELELDRAELVRKIDELQEQICRFGSVVEKQREGAAYVDPKIAPSNAYHGHVTYHAPLPPLPPDKHVKKLPYFKQFDDSTGMKKLYFPPNLGVNEFPVRVPRVNSYQSLGQGWQHPSRDHLLVEYMDFHQKQLLSFPQYHEPYCACVHCYNRNRPVPSKVPASSFGGKRFLEDSIFPSIKPQNRSPRANYSLLHSKDAKSHHRWRSDIDSDADIFQRSSQRKVVAARRSRRLCHPIAGGAPFIVCYSCFVSLKLPRKLKAREKNQHKLQCGSCSTVFLLEIKNKQLIISIDKYEKRQGLASQSPVFSEDANSLDNMIVQRDVSCSSELPMKDIASPTSPASSNHEANRYKQGNENKIADQQKSILHESASKENSAKDISSETEVEVSFQEYLTTGLSRDLVEVSKEDRIKTNKGGEGFLVGLLKWSFKGLSRYNQQMEDAKSNVSVNGQPIPEHIVKKVRKLAGPIEPGDYWYDCQAGFWGIMGKPCLGIIPAFIKEFGYPMIRTCAAGNTGILVNGRELHQDDLDMLASRGLPTTKEKSYIVEISGKVYEKDTGKELCSLGKLAPTVEKLKKGFGMKVPRKL